MVSQLRLVLFVGAVSLLMGQRVTAQPPGSLASDAVVAVVDGQSVRVRDLDAYSRTDDPRALFQLNRQLHDSRREVLRQFNEELLLDAEAARRGSTVEQLLNERLTSKPVTEAAVRRMIERIRGEQPAASDEQLRPLVRSLLQGQLRSEAKAKYVKELERAAR